MVVPAPAARALGLALRALAVDEPPGAVARVAHE
jgi:hypothetical protein